MESTPQTCPFSVTVRRNPHRKARPTTTSTKCPPNPVIPSSSPPLEVPSFPIEEILSMEVPINPNPNPNSDSASENLRVFLRIRPILPSKDQDRPKPRAKNAWPQNPAKMKSGRGTIASKKISGDSCIAVNDSQSVTLSPPLSLKESKRIKSVVFEGFSHVFASDSSQEQVFEKMVSPLVEEFLKGKSGMLAALGPSGSGKTHTVFGKPRDPGVIPRTLQRIFISNLDSASESQRSFSLSIFEIHSENGKGEKLFDLSPGGAELSMQQSTIRGLQEVIVSDATEAESFVAQAMLRRHTATTNSNSQSSRSQCIINIRSIANSYRGDEVNDAVLCIIDLAGAEREKKTGNQGARLRESNFINNTSMVFGSCLRSLLEHQKNPKKPLQKHFQNSLLTRYLRDYLEGKRRMALILTVKSGEEDYLDTTHLLRQASPFMSIKFDNAEEQSNIPCNKRQSQALSRNEKSKRMKFSGSGACEIAEKKASEVEQQAPPQEVTKGEPQLFKSEFPNRASLEANDAELVKSDRSYQILQSFAKTLWSVLKQHGKQLKVAEDEIQRIAEHLELEKTRNAELESELSNLKLNCTCFHQKSVGVALVEADTNFEPSVELNGLDSSNFDEPNPDHCSFEVTTPECSGAFEMYEFSPKRVQNNVVLNSSIVRASEDYKASETCDSNAELSLNSLSQVDEALHSDSKALNYIDNEQACDDPVTGLDSEAVDGSSLAAERSPHQYQVKKEALPSDLDVLECVGNEQESVTTVKSSGVDVAHDPSPMIEFSPQKFQIDAAFSETSHNTDVHDSRCFESNHACATSGMTDHTMSSSQPLGILGDSSHSSDQLDHLVSEEDQKLLNLPKTGDNVVAYSEDCASIDTAYSSAHRVEKPEKPSKPSVTEDLKVVAKPNMEQRIDTPTKAIKPKRRLLPVSSSLLRDFNTLDIGDRVEKPKGNRGGKKFSSDETNRTQGNITLMRLLQNHYGV